LRGSKGAGKRGVQIPVKARDTVSSKIVLTGPAIPASSYLIGVGVLSLEQSCRGVKLAIHLNAMPMFPLYAFLPWTEDLLHFTQNTVTHMKQFQHVIETSC